MKGKSKLFAHNLGNWVIYIIVTTHSAPLSIVTDINFAFVFPVSIFQPHISISTETFQTIAYYAGF